MPSPILRTSQAVDECLNRRSALVRARPVFTELMSEETLGEEPARHPSKKLKTVHSKISAIGRSKVSTTLFSSLLFGGIKRS
jgi:hypothetical protein